MPNPILKNYTVNYVDHYSVPARAREATQKQLRLKITQTPFPPPPPPHKLDVFRTEPVSKKSWMNDSEHTPTLASLEQCYLPP